MTHYSDDPRDHFEPWYARQHGIDPLKVKFLRSFTGNYRDPEITAAFRFFREEQQVREVA